MPKGSPGADVDVVVGKVAFPGLRMRLLSDRDKGEVIWELEFLGRAGNVEASETRRIRAVELAYWADVMVALQVAIDALTPRRRPDLAVLHPPGDPGSDGGGGS